MIVLRVVGRLSSSKVDGFCKAIRMPRLDISHPNIIYKTAIMRASYHMAKQSILIVQSRDGDLT